MTDRYTSGEYAARHPDWHEADASWKAGVVAGLLAKHGLRPRSICDVGCGTGGVLDALAGLMPGVRLVGYELSPQALELAPPERRARVQLVNADPTTVDERFDVMLMLDVFEHVEDYFGFLRGVRHLGRHAVFHIPLDVSVQMVLRPGAFPKVRETMGHIHSFTYETALATLDDTGYRVLAAELTTATLDLPPPSRAHAALRVPRRALYAVNPRLAARLLGGFALAVLAEPSR